MSKNGIVAGHLNPTRKSVFFDGQFGTVEIYYRRKTGNVMGRFLSWDEKVSHDTLPLTLDGQFVDTRISGLLRHANGEVLDNDKTTVRIAVAGLIGAFMSPKANAQQVVTVAPERTGAAWSDLG